MNLLEYALKIAKDYYEPKTYEHAMRVAGYVAQNELIDENRKESCIALAMMHDLIEDTRYRSLRLIDEYYRSSIDSEFKEALNILTKNKECEYCDYIKNIKKHAKDYSEAYWVKLADMKDHLTQTETLTDKMKEKYLAALPYLL